MSLLLSNFKYTDKSSTSFRDEMSSIFHSIPNLNEAKCAPDDYEIDFKLSTRFEMGSNKSDSGYAESNAEASRWLKMSGTLLHQNARAFLKINLHSNNKMLKESGGRKSGRQNLPIKINYFEDLSYYDKLTCNADLAQKATKLKADQKGIIRKNIIDLCEYFSEFMIQIKNLGLDVFNMNGLHLSDDLKSVMLLSDPSELFDQIIPEIMQLLALVFNFVGTKDMKCSFDWFDKAFTNFIDNDSVENFKSLIRAIQLLCSTVQDISTRMWVLKASIQVR